MKFSVVVRSSNWLLCWNVLVSLVWWACYLNNTTSRLKGKLRHVNRPWLVDYESSVGTSYDNVSDLLWKWICQLHFRSVGSKYRRFWPVSTKVLLTSDGARPKTLTMLQDGIGMQKSGRLGKTRHPLKPSTLCHGSACWKVTSVLIMHLGICVHSYGHVTSSWFVL